MEVACNMAPFVMAANGNAVFAAACNGNGNSVTASEMTEASRNSDNDRHTLSLGSNASTTCREYNNNNDDDDGFQSEINVISHSESKSIIAVNGSNARNNLRVTFQDEEDDEMNHNLASSQPLLGIQQLNSTADSSADSKLANSHPHVTIAALEIPKEDRAFRTKIDDSYQGWDNPFRPEGELSHDAEEILRLWKAGKLKEVSSLLEASEELHHNQEDKDEVDDDAGHNAEKTKKEPLQQPQQNGKPQPQIKNGKMDVKSSQQPLQPQKAALSSDSEPKKKKGCCSLM